MIQNIKNTIKEFFSEHFEMRMKMRLGLFSSVYFIYRFTLYFLGFTRFSVALGALLFVMCLCSFMNRASRIIYNCLLLIFAVVLLYHDSYLPPLTNLTVDFTDNIISDFFYYAEIFIDFINLELVVIFLFVLIVVFFLFDYIYSITVVAALLCYIGMSQLSSRIVPVSADMVATSVQNAVQSIDIPKQTGDTSSENIENYLKTFLEKEKNRLISMPQELAQDFAPFNVVIVNICSMAYDDIEASKLLGHEVFKKADYSFENFNSVSSYSTPATLRLLRANCGQMTEAEIYEGRRSECELLTSLEQVGYQSSIYFDHNGAYGDYLKTLRQLAGLNPPLNDPKLLHSQYTSFDGTPIYSDKELFNAYLYTIKATHATNNVSFMNLLSLHDGNRLTGQNRSQPYAPRLKLMLDNLSFFIDELEKSKTNTLLIIVPEHGAAIRGDKMQIAKLREIPTDKITRIPVLVKFFGANGSFDQDTERTVKKISGFYSYQSLSEIIRRSLANNVFSKDSALCTVDDVFVDLPQTAFIGESTNAFYMNFLNSDFYKLKGEEWAPYKK